MTTVQLQTSFLKPVPGDAAGRPRWSAGCCAWAATWCSARSWCTTPAATWPPTPPPPTRCCSRRWDSPALDYRIAFDQAPIGLVLSRHRLMSTATSELLAMFGAQREQLVGQLRGAVPQRPTSSSAPASASWPAWTPGPLCRRAGDEALDGPRRRAVLVPCLRPRARPAQPHAAGIWAFEDLSARRVLKVDFTPREREIAALLVEG
jgi:hypothetical protein